MFLFMLKFISSWLVGLNDCIDGIHSWVNFMENNFIWSTLPWVFLGGNAGYCGEPAALLGGGSRCADLASAGRQASIKMLVCLLQSVRVKTRWQMISLGLLAVTRLQKYSQCLK